MYGTLVKITLMTGQNIFGFEFWFENDRDVLELREREKNVDKNALKNESFAINIFIGKPWLLNHMFYTIKWKCNGIKCHHFFIRNLIKVHTYAFQVDCNKVLKSFPSK